MFGVGLYCLGALRGLCGFLCACGVRRIKGLRRVCLSFVRFSSSFVLVFALLLCSLPIFWGFAFVVLGLSCLLVLFVLVSLWVFVFSFSLSVYAQKERARRVGASSLVLLWACAVKFASLFRLSSLYSISLSSVCQNSWSQCVLLFCISSTSLF